MPLLLISLFLVARTGCYQNIKVISEADTLAGLTNGLPDILTTVATVNNHGYLTETTLAVDKTTKSMAIVYTFLDCN